jgi:hypothetical protein
VSIGTRLRAAGKALAQPDAQSVQALALHDYAVSTPRVLRASGVRITGDNLDGQLKALTANKAQWQKLAWGYRRLIGELRYALRFRANAISRVTWYAAQNNPDPKGMPIPLALRDDEDREKAERVTISPDLAAAAEEELARLPLDAGYSFLGVWSENFDVAGECWLHGYPDPVTNEETWSIRSVSEIEITNSRIAYKDPTLGGQLRDIDLDTEELYRLWVPSPEFSHLADSSLYSMLDVLEDIVLVGREMRAASRSRAAANGILKIPTGLTLLRATRNDDDDNGTTPASNASEFMADLTAAFVAPISNEGDPGAVAPVGIIGDKDDLAAFEHMRFEREDSPLLMDKQERSLARMAVGLELPAEILTGLAEVNHWTVWSIDASTTRHHFEPGIRLMADSATMGFLRVALMARGFSSAEVAQVRIWYSLDNLTENVNRRQDALDARDRLAIGNAAFLDALGFDPEDAPTPEEMLMMIAGKQGFDQAAAAAVLDWFARRDAGEPVPELPVFPSTTTAQTGPGTPALPAATPTPTGPGETPAAPVPDTAPPGVVVAAALPACRCGFDVVDGRCSAPTPGHHDALVILEAMGATLDQLTASAAEQPPAPYRLEVDVPRELVEAERALRDRIVVAADAAIARAVEKAGGRLRSKATADKPLSLSLRGLDALAVARTVGPDRAFALGATLDHLLGDAFSDLSGKFRRWVTLGIDAVIDRVLSMLGLTRDDGRGRKVAERMAAEMGGRVDGAWDTLNARLEERAKAVLFDLDTGDVREEAERPDGFVPAGLVRAALAEIGGEPETSGGLDEHGRSVTGEPVGGLSNGATVLREMEDGGAHLLGYLWVYGITMVPRQFHPHKQLDGKRFADWHDELLDTSEQYGGKYRWVGEHFQPGDHEGCMCDYVPGFAVPEYSDLVAERLASPSAAMRDILVLAESDDRAGRTDTTAQAERDRYLHVQQLQSRFMKGGR